MRFKTILTLPGLSLRERGSRMLDLALLNTSDHLPNRMIRWVLVVAGNRYARKSGEVIPDMIFMDVLKGFDQ